MYNRGIVINMTKLVGLIGYGKMGKIRANIIRNMDRTKVMLRGVYDTIPKNRSYMYDSLEELMNDSDYMIVSVPHIYTAEYAMKALELGCIVGIEKPPGISSGECAEIINVMEKMKGHAVVFFNHRHHDAIIEAKRWIQKDKLLWIRAVYGKYELENWRTDPTICGGHGILLSQGIHMVDLLTQFAGKLLLKGALVNKVTDNIETDVMALFKGKNNVPVSLHSSAQLWKNTFRLEMGFKNIYINIDGFLSSTRSFGFVEKLTIGFRDCGLSKGNPSESIQYFSVDNSFKKETENFINGVKDRTVYQALDIMKLIEEIYKKGSE